MIVIVLILGFLYMSTVIKEIGLVATMSDLFGPFMQASPVIALAVIGWPKYARLARGLTLSQKSAVYLMAARLAGCSELKLLVRHILPNILGPILVTAVLDVGTMMMELAGLSFLGLGVQPPMAEWGSMINDGRSMLQIAPWMALAPGLAIFITVMIFNLLGDALRDFLDPRERDFQAKD